MKNFKILTCTYLFPLAAFSQGLDLKLMKIEVDKITNYCTVFIDATNNTNLNLTQVNAKITLREGDGSVIGKQLLIYKRIKKGATETQESVGANSCGSVKEISVQFEYVYVDGEGSNKAISIVDNGKRISAVKGVTLK